MDSAQIIAKARRKAKCTTANVDDTSALSYLNSVKDEFWAEIVSRLEEDYNWQEWTGNLIAWVSEYPFPQKTLVSDALKTVKGLSLCYDSTLQYDNGGLIYEKATPAEAETLEKDWRYYEQNRDTDTPLYKIVDNSIIIAPIPELSVTGWMKIRGAKRIEDYTLTTVEYDIWIDKDYHEVLVDWLAEQLAIDKGLPVDDIQFLANSYAVRKEKAIKMMAMRKEWPTTFDYPQ